MIAIEAVETLAAGRDRADDHPLANHVAVLETRPKLVDHTDGLVAQNEARFHRILSTHDVHIGAANGGRGDPNHGFARARMRTRDLLNRYPVFPLEHDGFHRFHWHPPKRPFDVPCRSLTGRGYMHAVPRQP